MASVQRRLDVLVGETRVGELRSTRDGARERAAFRYHAGWLGSPARYGLDPTLPLVEGAQFAPAARDAGQS